MPAKPSSPEIPLPRGWPSRIKSAVLHVIGLGQFTLAYTRGWAANGSNSRVRLKADLDCAHQEIALPREELRIEKIPPRRRAEPISVVAQEEGASSRFLQRTLHRTSVAMLPGATQ